MVSQILSLRNEREKPHMVVSMNVRYHQDLQIIQLHSEGSSACKSICHLREGTLPTIQHNVQTVRTL